MLIKLRLLLDFITFELGRRLYWRPFRNSFSQNQEDLVIDRLLQYKKKGFYVDVGAYDPDRMSNTRRFYLRGWRGINIEPHPQRFQRFVRARPRDINLNLGVAERKGKLTFYQFVPGALSTFSEEEALLNRKQGFWLTRKLTLPVDTLGNILARYAPSKRIDFFSIDTEGFDLKVLQGNDWQRFRPSLVCLESQVNTRGLENRAKEQRKFLEKVGYRLVFRNRVNSLYLARGQMT